MGLKRTHFSLGKKHRITAPHARYKQYAENFLYCTMQKAYGEIQRIVKDAVGIHVKKGSKCEMTRRKWGGMNRSMVIVKTN